MKEILWITYEYRDESLLQRGLVSSCPGLTHTHTLPCTPLLMIQADLLSVQVSVVVSYPWILGWLWMKAESVRCNILHEDQDFCITVARAFIETDVSK